MNSQHSPDRFFYKLSLVLLIGMTLGLSACMVPEEPFSSVDDIPAQFIGHWKNVSEQDESLNEVIILKQADQQMSIQLWGDCFDGKCVWGTKLIDRAELINGPVSLSWQGDGITIEQEMQMLPNNRLQIVSQIEETNSNLIETETHTFFQTQSKTLFEQVERKEVFRTDLRKTRIPASPSGENLLKAGSILLFESRNGNYGKIQIRGNDAILTMRWKNWRSDGSIMTESDYLETRPGFQYDMEQGREVDILEQCIGDFLMAEPNANERWLEPSCGATFVVYHVED